MKNLIIGIALITMVGGCKKILNPSEPEHYISGHLYNDCSGTPIKNRGLYIYREGLRGAGETTKGTCTTDSTGYFKMDYRANNAGEPLELRFANSNYAIVYLPGNPIVNIDNAKLYGVTSSTNVIRLNVLTPYTSNDTLEITKGTLPNLKFAGPFTNGILFTMQDFNLLTPQYKNGTGFIATGVSYRINNAPFTSKLFDMVACKTQNITIDIQ